MKTLIVSVFMPVYNGERYVRQAIDSVLNQTLSNFEFIIIDDGSTDSTLSILKSYKDKRIKLFRNRKNLGIARTINKAIKMSKGKYVARMDSDDVCMPERLEREVTFLESNKKISACGTWANAIDEEGNSLYNMRSPTGILLKYNFWKPSPLISSSLLMRRKSAMKVCPYLAKFVVCEDYDFIVRFMKRYVFLNIPLYLMKYRVHSGGITKTKREIMCQNNYSIFIENYNFRDLKLNEFCSISCMDYNMNFFKRLLILVKLGKKIDYPWWFLLLDSGYYVFRQVLYKIEPGLRKF